MDIKTLKQVLQKFARKKILVIGDVILDEYIFGKVSRISPEAPVPVVEITKRTHLPGGAAYVASHINNLGAIAYLIGVTGNDSYGDILVGELEKANIATEGLIKDSERPTIVKTRVIAQNQQIVRVDCEKRFPVNQKIVKSILDYIKDIIKETDAVIISDYNKGLVIPTLFKEVIKLANKFDKPITVDPKPTYCLLYKNVTIITPNTSEAGSVVNKSIVDEKTLIQAGNELLKKTNSKSILITRGEHGMALFEKNKDVVFIPTSAKEVYDVTGAGDTVISVLTLGLATGASILNSSYLANLAAGIVVEKLGTAKLTLEEIKEILMDSTTLTNQ